MIRVPLLYALAGVALFALGLLHFVARRHMIRRILGLNIMGSGVFLVLIALAKRGTDGPDPVPQAMVLTGLVVAVSATAVALYLAVLAREGSGGAAPPPTEPTPPA